MSVIYAQTQLPVGTWFGWTPHIYTASEFVHRYETLPIRHGDQYPPADWTMALIYGWGHLAGQTKVVSSHEYEALSADDTGPHTHWAYNRKGVVTKLRQTKVRSQRDAGFDYPMPIAVLTMDKDVYSVPQGHLMVLLGFKNKVASQIFLPGRMDIPSGHARFEHGDVSVVDGSLPGLPEISSHYHVQLVFTVSGMPMSFVRKHHYWEHEGAISAVFNALRNKPQYEDFKVADQTDLNYLITRFVY